MKIPGERSQNVTGDRIFLVIEVVFDDLLYLIV